jgi:Ca2+-binding RTX toxin-like protein
MKNVMQGKLSRAAALTVAAAVAAAGGTLTDPAKAAPSIKPVKEGKAKHPTLKQGLLTIDGTAASDRISLRLRAGDPGTLEVDFGDDGSADFRFRRSSVARIAVDAEAGNDLVRIDETNGVFTDAVSTTIGGGDGDDTLAGGSGAETLQGGDGNDSIDGNRGNDLALLGAGDDTFVWDPGDGSDTVEGQAGTDTMRFNGSNANERIDLSANGGRLRFVRDVAGITMDSDDVERVDFNALGGTDVVTVNDLTGTDVANVDLDLGGDGQRDNVIVNGTNGDEAVEVLGGASGVNVVGLPKLVAIQHQEANDQLAVSGLGGKDVLSAATLAAQAIGLTLDGGAGDDTLAGGQDSEVLIGGDGNDSIDGNRGNDLALLGAGDDTFVWDPGDGSDTVEGQAGTDTMRFNGSNANERIDLSANGGRLRFVRDVAGITMDSDDVERVDFNALGGTDVVTVNDLTGTDVTSVNVDLAGAGGSGDGQPDNVIVNGTNGDDAIQVNGDASGVQVSGLRAVLHLTNAEVPTDMLTINALGGNDVVEASGLAANAISLTLDGGAGDDVLIGSAGSDILFGRDGDDVLLGGPGQDVLDGGTGDNIVIQD